MWLSVHPGIVFAFLLNIPVSQGGGDPRGGWVGGWWGSRGGWGRG